MKSMTAFGRARRIVGGKDITVELRSVNNRYMDCSVKLPRAYSFLEERVKPHLQATGISRGKIDVFIGIEQIDTPDVSIELDAGYAEAYVRALRALQKACDLPDDITTMRVAQNRDLFVIRKPEDDMDRDWADVCVVLDEALCAFVEGREREGARIESDLREKIAGIRTMTDKIADLSESDVATYREKLEARLREILSDNKITVEESRILTECAVFADRVAIDEELVRLRSHFVGFEDIDASSEPAGRKLDFLMQEMNRETNTIGSKANNARIARIVVNMKGELEKIREQVQNVE